jgi:hypothetical protein
MVDVLLALAIICWCFWALPGTIVEYKFQEAEEQ